MLATMGVLRMHYEAEALGARSGDDPRNDARHVIVNLLA
jgi:hypothetical protein